MTSRELAPPRGQSTRRLPAPLTCAHIARPSRRSLHTTPFRLDRAVNPGAGIRCPALLRIGHPGGWKCCRRSGFALDSGCVVGGTVSREPCHSLAPCGFLGDVAPPARALLPAGLEAGGAAVDRAERCRGTGGPLDPVSENAGELRDRGRRGENTGTLSTWELQIPRERSASRAPGQGPLGLRNERGQTRSGNREMGGRYGILLKV